MPPTLRAEESLRQCAAFVVGIRILNAEAADEVLRAVLVHRPSQLAVLAAIGADVEVAGKDPVGLAARHGDLGRLVNRVKGLVSICRRMGETEPNRVRSAGEPSKRCVL